MINEASQTFNVYSNFTLEMNNDFLPNTQYKERILGFVKSYHKHPKVDAYTFLIKVGSNDYTIWYHCVDPEKIFHLKHAKGFYIYIINTHSEQKGEQK